MEDSIETLELNSDYWYSAFRVLRPLLEVELKGAELQVLNALYALSNPQYAFIDALAYFVKRRSFTTEILNHAKQEIVKSTRNTLFRQDTLVVLVLRDIIISSVASWSITCIQPAVASMTPAEVRSLLSADRNAKWVQANCKLYEAILNSVLKSTLPKEAVDFLYDIVKFVCAELSMKRKEASLAVISNLIVLRAFAPAIVAKLNDKDHALIGVQKMVLCVFLDNEPTNMPPLMVQLITEYQEKIKTWAYNTIWRSPVETLHISELLPTPLLDFMPPSPDDIDVRCVTKWLTSVGLRHCAKQFIANAIEGELIFTLDIGDLLELQLDTRCRDILMRSINQLCKLYQRKRIYRKTDFVHSSSFDEDST